MRWRKRIDQVCEGNQDLIDIREAISDVRWKRKMEWRRQKDASDSSTSGPSFPRAAIEDIHDTDVATTSIAEPEDLHSSSLVQLLAIPPESAVVSQEIAALPRTESPQNPSPTRPTLLAHETGEHHVSPATTTPQRHTATRPNNRVQSDLRSQSIPALPDVRCVVGRQVPFLLQLLMRSMPIRYATRTFRVL